ncbi:MAG: class I SAM-dependent methyltransferase [Proteobacteria bacterium]|nr:class I SAM-dependent methyltransferase [Pseudomonadota bacterium]
MPHSDYDYVPYESYSFAQTHIAHLELMGQMFGMNCADARKCRVLELGGASGGNLIPMAAEFPNSEFVCVDLSSVQIEEGARHAADLNLANISFLALSILDIPGSIGEFDYILCHGVYSWVPEEVREKIFAIARDLLSPEGIALVSYNTLPGWGLARCVRDMMRYHTSGTTDPVDRVRQSREFVSFVQKFQASTRSPWTETVGAEATRIAGARDSYVFHEFLEDSNHPIYFSEFMQRAHEFGLQYLGDSQINFMFLENQPRLIAERLAPLGTEHIEQYSDFLHNRRFRFTLLVREGRALARAIDPAKVDLLYLRSLLVPDSRVPPNLERPGRNFRGPEDMNYSTVDFTSTAVLSTLADLAALPVTPEQVVEEVAERYRISDRAAILQSVRTTAIRLFMYGQMQLYLHPPGYVGRCSERPEALRTARYQAGFRSLVTNGRHEMVALQPIERIALPLLDGTRTLQFLTDSVIARVRNSGLVLQREGVPISDAAELEREVAAHCATAIQAFAAQALLVA